MGLGWRGIFRCIVFPDELGAAFPSYGPDWDRGGSGHRRVTPAGEPQDLASNLIIGDESLEKFRAWRFDGRSAPEQLQLHRECSAPKGTRLATSALDQDSDRAAAAAHLGNYGLIFSEDGQPSLAPFYDILPMALAPRHDELPDEHLVPLAAEVDARIQAWVEKLRHEVEADDHISQGFKRAWRSYLGRG